MSDRAFFLGLALGVCATGISVLVFWEVDLWIRSRVRRGGDVTGLIGRRR